jgi:hypothetical protein
MRAFVKLLCAALVSGLLVAASAAAQFLIPGITLQGGGGGGGGDPTAGLLPTAADGWANWQTAGLQAIPLSGYIAGTTLTVTTSHSNALGPSQAITGPGVTSGTTITAMGSGAGDTGTYTISPSQTVGSSGSPIAMTANGIPNRSTISTTLTPSGGDDTAQINNALAACPAGQVVLLSLGVFKIDSVNGGIHMDVSGCTMRGSGAGAQKSTSLNPVNGGTAIRACVGGTLVTINGGNYCTDSTATQLVQTTRTGSNSLFTMWRNNTFYGTSYDLAADAVQGAFSVTLTATPSPAINQGDLIILDENSANDPNTYVGNNFSGFTRATGRNITEQKEVASVSGATITFVTPIMYPYHTSSTCSGCDAQVTTWSQTPQHGGGIENMFVWGGVNTNIGLGNGGGNPCAYCWVKNVETMWSTGCAICIAWGYHDVIRDSFIHEAAVPENGGAGYLTAISSGSTETLIENNVMWYGNKYDVMQTAGGGNVLAYNYGDDSFGFTYPDEPESGWNDAHNYSTHLGLMEGNYGANFAGDSYWGSAIFISAYRNWFSGLRASSPPNAGYAPLNTYSASGTGCGTIYYGDYRGDSRAPIQVQKASFYNGFVGNVLGYSGQTLINESGRPGYTCTQTQTAFMVQVTTNTDYNAMIAGNDVPMWILGEYTAPGGINSYDPTTVNTITRLANWDWVSSAESCYTFGSAATTACTGAATALPNSFYLASKPSFFGTHPWPWVSPTTGATSGGSGGTSVLLPAMYCFQQGKMPTCALP